MGTRLPMKGELSAGRSTGAAGSLWKGCLSTSVGHAEPLDPSWKIKPVDICRAK